MARPEECLEAWRAAGLIDEETAGRIRVFEAARASKSKEDGPTLTEAAVYLGLAVIAVGVLILFGSNWDHLDGWAHIASPLVPAVLALGAALLMRRMIEPGVRRGSHVAALVAGALLTVSVAAAGREAGASSETTLAAAGCAALVAAVALWPLWQGHLLLVGLSGAAILFSVGVGANAPAHGFIVGAITLAFLGSAGIALAELGALRPRLTARVFAGAGLAGGAFFAGVEGSGPAWTEAVVFLAGLILIVLSIRRGTLAYMAAAVMAMFLGLIDSVVRHVQDPTVAALALMLIGGAVIATVLVLIRLKPWTTATRRPSVPAP